MNVLVVLSIQQSITRLRDKIKQDKRRLKLDKQLLENAERSLVVAQNMWKD